MARRTPGSSRPSFLASRIRSSRKSSTRIRPSCALTWQSKIRSYRSGMGKKPVTPLVACDTFVLNEKHDVLLIQRADNKYWALPGGCHDLGETPKLCAERECREETGLDVEVTGLLGVLRSEEHTSELQSQSNL